MKDMQNNEIVFTNQYHEMPKLRDPNNQKHNEKNQIVNSDALFKECLYQYYNANKDKK